MSLALQGLGRQTLTSAASTYLSPQWRRRRSSPAQQLGDMKCGLRLVAYDGLWGLKAVGPEPYLIRLSKGFCPSQKGRSAPLQDALWTTSRARMAIAVSELLSARRLAPGAR